MSGSGRTGLRAWLKRERVQSVLLVSPAVATLVLVALFPIVAAIWLSLQRRILLFGEQSFIGWDNYLLLFSDTRFHAALGRTFYFAAVSVSLELLLGLPIALLLHRAFPGRGLLRALVLIPWAIPTVVSARMWAWLFHPELGLVNRLLPWTTVNWLGTPGWALHAAIVVDVWKSTPFVAILLLAGLQGIPEDVHRAARMDGAGPWTRLWRITLPLLRPAIVLAVLFRLLDALRVFDAIWVLTGGGPAHTTESMSIYAYKTLLRAGNFGYGTTLAIANFACVMLVAAIYLRLIRAGRDVE